MPLPDWEAVLNKVHVPTFTRRAIAVLDVAPVGLENSHIDIRWTIKECVIAREVESAVMEWLQRIAGFGWKLSGRHSENIILQSAKWLLATLL